MLGEAGSGSLVPASRWSTATPGEAGVDDGDGDWAALILLSLCTSCRGRCWTCPSSSANERSQFGVKRSSSRRDESNTDVNRRTSSL